MNLQILLLKKDSDQEARDGDLHPPPYDLLGRFLVSGTYDAVVLANVHGDVNLRERKRLPMDGDIYLVDEALPVYDGPPTHGVTRW